MLMLGEVHTGLLQHSTPLSPALSEHILGLVRGERPRRFERPIAYAVSPDLLTGVDCHLPTASGARVRGVGTVVHRATVIGGHVLQGSAVVQLSRGQGTGRRPWSHYLAHPGSVETAGRNDWTDLARGFATTRPSTAATLDLGAVSGRLMDTVQVARELDRRPPFRTARTRLRWVALTSGEPEPAGPGQPAGLPDVAFGIESRQLRTLRLRCLPGQAAAVAALCEDLALHDWLLTTLLEVIERSRIGTGPRQQAVDRLGPAIDHLLHLWMPAARLDLELTTVWESLERRPGFSRQWQASVNRIRDQIALSTITLLNREPSRMRS
jgi:hypothetical protein